VRNNPRAGKMKMERANIEWMAQVFFLLPGCSG
jgi:hypothetical protein